MNVIGIGVSKDIGDGILNYSASAINRQAKITDVPFFFFSMPQAPPDIQSELK